MDKPTITMDFIFGGRPPPPRHRGVKAWLLEWLPSGVDAKKLVGLNRDSGSAEVAGILPPLLRWDRVYEVARAIFFAQRVEPLAMLAFRDVGWRKVSLFMPTFPFSWEMRMPGDEKLSRGPHHEWFVVAGAPGLYGRRVDNLRASKDGALQWTEQEAPPAVPWEQGRP
jgi:hypothetical protein